MKQVILSCPTLKKEIQHLLAEYKLDTPVYFLPKRLHSDPKELAEYLQNTIDSFYNVDRILICVSGCGGGTATIKSHHNVGGLPNFVDFKEIIEPLRYLFKDEVRQAGRELGLQEYLVTRQPFPGPGLAIRIIGDVTPEKVAIVQDADYFYSKEVDKLQLAQHQSQYFDALSNIHSVGVAKWATSVLRIMLLPCVL